MKQIVILLTIVALNFSYLNAQKGKVYAAKTAFDMADMDAAKKAIDEAISSGNEKSDTWPFTYIVAGRIYRKLYEEGKDTDGLKKALDYYLKAIDLDQKGDAKGKNKGRYKNELFLDIEALRTELTAAGVDGFNKEDYDKAIFAFESILKLNNKSLLEENSTKIDTAIIYNTALAAYNGEKYDIAEKYFKEAINYGYGGGDAVLLLNQVYVANKDSVQMGENLKVGFEKYPDDARILTALINYYLSSKKNKEALDYLNKAIEQDNTNASYYYARGVLFDQSKELDKAEADYLKCLELDGNYFNSLYNLGVLYYNEGVQKHNDANEISDLKKYNAAKAVANKSFEKALPYMEKARKILEEKENPSPDELIAVYDSLKNLYYRFNKLDKYEQMKKLIEEVENQNK